MLSRSRNDLSKVVEEQKRQLENYEKRVRDIVRAYKGLNAEKDALQAVVETLGSKKDDQNDSNSKAGPSSTSTTDENGSEQANVSEEDRLKVLQNALVVLTTEKSRREAAFLSDKRVLIAENEALKERLEKSANETEVQAEELERRIKDLRSKLKRIEHDREKELADHGSVLAAMQQQYAKERSNVEQLERQIAELYKKMHSKEEAPNNMKLEITTLNEQLKTTMIELEYWKKKAKKTPTVQMMESEMNNIKESSRSEIAELKAKLDEVNNTKRETRLQELELRLQEMMETMGTYERVKVDLQNQVQDLQRKNKEMMNETALLKKSLHESSELGGESVDSLKKKLLLISKKLRTKDKSINFHELLNLEADSYEQKRRYELLHEEFERYKLKAEAVLKSRSTTYEAPQGDSDSSNADCSSCVAAEADLRHMRSVVASLHDKLQAFKLDHANSKNEYEEKTSELQRTIADMQVNQENVAIELRNQMHRKISEMETEMQKQRIRTMDILAEKENELEITKAILASIRSRNFTDPMDPPQRSSPHQIHPRANDPYDSTETVVQNQNVPKDGRANAVVEYPSSEADSYSSVTEDIHSGGGSTSPIESRVAHSFASNANIGESLNVFYEQELARKERDILELRNTVQNAERNMREIQQSSLTKDLRHYEMIEKLKDEIRIVEGKLKFFSRDANMEYLRNIFIQLLHCENSSGRKHILKAIGAVLKLSSSEMRAIERTSS